MLRPAIYYIVEDVVAVDGNGGLEYREAWTKRYEASPVFRKMILELSIAWMLAFYVLAGVFTALVFWLPKEAAYAVGWAGPFPLAGLLAVWTIFYVKYMLKEEAEEDDGTRGYDERAPLLEGLEGGA